MARTGEPAGAPLRHRDGVLFATFSRDGERALTCGEDFLAMLWNPTTGEPLSSPLRHHERVRYAAFSEDDRLVATVANDQTISVWSADNGEFLTSLAFQSPALRKTGGLDSLHGRQPRVESFAMVWGRACLEIAVLQ